MRVVRARGIGFCYGVRRAIELATRRARSGPIRSLGPLIHNRQEVARLESLGIRVADSLEACAGETLLIRSHGALASDIDRARALGITLVDATCPHVERCKEIVLSLQAEGRKVLLHGDRSHPEVRAILSHARGEIEVIRGPEDLEDLPTGSRLGLVAQTTQDQNAFADLAQMVRRRCPDAVVRDTICQDAARRQQEAARLAAEVDWVIVIGGRESANTSRLTQICRRHQPRTVQIEQAGELSLDALSGIGSVGLISGASTPAWVIDRVEERLLAFASSRAES